MDGLNGLELELAARDADGLRAQTHEVHLNGRLCFVPARAVPEALQIKIAVELAVYARQKIEIELCSHACAIVVSGDENLEILLHIHADDCTAVSAHLPAQPSQKGSDFRGVEIADGRARKEGYTPPLGNPRRQCERGGRVGDDRLGRQAGKAPTKPRNSVIEEATGDVDGNIETWCLQGTDQDLGLDSGPGAILQY